MVDRLKSRFKRIKVVDKLNRQYVWNNARKATPKSLNLYSDLYWAIMINDQGEREMTILSYNFGLDCWEIMEKEIVLYWMPLGQFMPCEPFANTRERVVK